MQIEAIHQISKDKLQFLSLFYYREVWQSSDPIGTCQGIDRRRVPLLRALLANAIIRSSTDFALTFGVKALFRVFTSLSKLLVFVSLFFAFVIQF